jgi:hypothetical protein
MGTIIAEAATLPPFVELVDVVDDAGFVGLVVVLPPSNTIVGMAVAATFELQAASTNSSIAEIAH